MRQILRVLVLVALATSSDAFADERWSLQIFGGAPYNFNLPLTINQSGHPDLNVTGNYESRPFEVTYYYAWRMGVRNGNRAWEIELVHNKLYLKDKPPEIQEFSISHGYNLLTVNRAWEERGVIYRAVSGW